MLIDHAKRNHDIDESDSSTLQEKCIDLNQFQSDQYSVSRLSQFSVKVVGFPQR